MSELELFFDLVFVYAITRVAQVMLYTTARSIVHAALLLAVMWWVWISYAWMGNVVQADRGAARSALLAAMAVSLVLSLAIPEAFDDAPGGVDGPLTFAAAYGVVRVIHMSGFWALSSGDIQLRRQLTRWIPSLVAAVALLVVAARTHNRTQTLLWVAALACDYLGTMLAGADWRLNSASHFAERHGLIILIALGESIVEIGAGVAGLPLSWQIIVASLLGLGLCALMWWAYFDITAPYVARVLARAEGAAQVRIAQHCYTFGHLPMVMGIVGAALGLEKVVAAAGDPAGTVSPARTQEWSVLATAIMFGGVVMYLLALVVFHYRGGGVIAMPRILAAVALFVAAAVTTTLPLLGRLAVLDAVLAIMIGYETLRFPHLRSGSPT